MREEINGSAPLPSIYLVEEKLRHIDRLAAHAVGVPALRRLLPIAQGHSGQCRIVAAFLLGLYNGTRFPFDMTDFRCLDRAIFEDCITVLKMDNSPMREVHTYFENGSAIFEQLAVDWNIKDRSPFAAGAQ